MEVKGWRSLKESLTSFRGYRVSRKAVGKQDELATGNRARGLVHVWNDRGDVVIHTKNFWQQFPKAAEVAADGTVRVGLWPREFKYPQRRRTASSSPRFLPRFIT